MSSLWKSAIDRVREQIRAVVFGPGGRGGASKGTKSTQTFGMTPAEYAAAVKSGLNPRDWTEPR